jgi:LPS-assembly protein
MKSRSNLVITIAALCHLLVLPGIVTSQLPSSSSSDPIPQQCTVHTFTKPAPGRAREPVTIKAGQCEKAEGVYKLHGSAEIDFRNYIIRADEMTYSDDSGEATGTGNLTLDGGEYDTHIEASHGTYNVESGVGRFYDVYGTTGMRLKGKNIFLTTSNPFAFTGKWVEKVSAMRLIVHHGTVTSCQLPKPKWTFNAERVVVDIGGEAKIFNGTFRVKGVPSFYLPFAEHPVERVGRQTGFLIPSMGQSTVKGTIVGDSFFWAIDRSTDATLGAQYYSSRGVAQIGNFRMRPNPNTYLDVNYFGVIDRGLPDPGNPSGPKINQGGEDLRVFLVSNLANNFRGVVSAEYLSRYVFRAAFEENFALAVVSEVNSVGFLSRNSNGYSFNAQAGKYQNFQSTTPGDLITLIHAPSLDTSTLDRKLGNAPVYWGYEAAGEGLSRTTPTFKSADLVGRLDIRPHLSMPLFLRGWTLDPELAMRDTFYTQSKIPQGTGPGMPSNDPINRRDIEAAFELRPPTMVRVFQKPHFGRKLKHTIEPRLTYRYVNGIDNFNRIIRFDERDILSDSNSLQLSIMNRVYARRSPDKNCPSDTSKEKGPACPARAREFLSWEVSGKYFFDPSFGGALVPGTRNVFYATEDLTGIAFLTEPRNFAPVVSRLRMQLPGRVGVQWNLDYDTKKGHVTGSSIFLDYRIGPNIFFSGSHSLLQAPGEVLSSTSTTSTTQTTRFNQFHILTGYGNPSRRGINAAMNFVMDANAKKPFNILQYSIFQTSYNWDCCGLTFEYRRFTPGPVRNENLYRFAFSVANIGTFGNLKRQERIF